MAERYMQESVLTEKGRAEWEKYGRPPYKAWDARPEGSVMAFRDDFNQSYDEVARKVDENGNSKNLVPIPAL
jgi:hypothetical protein